MERQQVVKNHVYGEIYAKTYNIYLWISEYSKDKSFSLESDLGVCRWL